MIKSLLSVVICLLSASVALSSCSGSDKNNPASAVENQSSYSPTRLADSPYPVSKKPDTLFVISDVNLSNSQKVTLQSLQGILAQSKPRIYVLNDNSIYKFWLTELEKNYGISSDYKYNSDLQGLIKHFKNEISGYILATLNDDYGHSAISLAGIKKALVVTSDNEQMAKDAGLSLIADARNLTFTDFLDKYSADINNNIAVFQSAQKLGFLTDYSTFGKMIHMFEKGSGTLTDKVALLLKGNSPLVGWGTDEYAFVQGASRNSLYVHPADWAMNLSVFSNLGCETRQPAAASEPAEMKNVHTVCFVVTDGDNIQWMLNSFLTDTKLYGNPKRGTVSLGWTMSPAMCELAPTVMKKIYDASSRTEGKRDCFVAGPSGVGYGFPDLQKDLNGFAALTVEYMKKSDLRILNVLGNSMDNAYLYPLLKQEQIDAVFFYYYSNYSGGEGAIKWVEGKPVITGRYNLWTPNFENASSLAEKINFYPTDITSPKAYTLIPVHAWSQGVSDILEAVSLFNKNVRVVAPDEFVALIKKNVVH